MGAGTKGNGVGIPKNHSVCCICNPANVTFPTSRLSAFNILLQYSFFHFIIEIFSSIYFGLRHEEEYVLSTVN
jgi:hypothetical protein